MIVSLGLGEKIVVRQTGMDGSVSRVVVTSTEAGLTVSGGTPARDADNPLQVEARIVAEVRRVVQDHLGEQLGDQDVTFEELGADSLDAVELVMALEETFGIEISDEDADAVVTFRDACVLVERLGG